MGPRDPSWLHLDSPGAPDVGGRQTPARRSEGVHFSARTAWPRAENRLSIQLRALREAGAPLVDLTVSNPTTADLPYDRAGILAAWAAPEALGYAPDALGLASARAAVSDYYARRGLTVSPEHVLLTASTSEAYTHLMRLLCDA